MPRFKYPRTPHLPWSPGASEDDIVSASTDSFKGRPVVVTEKMDGENTTLYRDGLHARSIDSQHHASRDWVKAMHGSISYQIPEGWRICGENLFAKHSILYTSLPSYFLVFSIWDDTNTCLSWQDTVEWCELVGLSYVPVLYSGAYDDTTLRALSLGIEHCTQENTWPRGADPQEGYVVRLADAFPYSDFGRCVRKWVRTGHVTSEDHWMHSEIVPNKLVG